MEVRVGSYYHDPATEAQREIHVSLSSEDGLEMYGEKKWNSWDFEDKSHKLTLMADLLMLGYAQTRGLRGSESVKAEKESLIHKEMARASRKSS